MLVGVACLVVGTMLLGVPWSIVLSIIGGIMVAIGFLMVVQFMVENL